ncbi:MULTISPECIES: MFS transporter [unclassified Ochrobactrum]|uniref:MFS transporter n=1 Tax=unclassified Ochrobactrum TaxID=239106 RepID=UPI000DEF3CC2|nr:MULTISPECIES: MFS transporter [unclassified Ochrobactrum]MBQ0710918.1 MFS transporter [Ochrobactrum sp. AP1BH01-1]
MTAPHNSTHSIDARPLDRRDFRTLGLSAIGGALELYDFIIFAFFASTLGHLFFPPDMSEWLALVQTFGIFAVGYLARPLGGIVLAHFGDRFGRKRVFTFSVLLMGGATLATACLPTYATLGIAAPVLLTLLRIMQGIAVGGEVPGAWTFVAEHAPANRVGLACGLLSSGFTFGILLGSLIAALINWIYTPEQVAAYAWRIPFLIGGILGALGLYLRRGLTETPVFIAMAKSTEQRKRLPLGTVLRHHRRGVVITMLLAWCMTSAITITMLMTPTFLQKLYGYSPLQSLTATSFGLVFQIAGAALGGIALDRFGSGRFLVATGVVFAVVTFTFYSFAGVSLWCLFALYGVVGCVDGMAGATSFTMVRVFPAHVRFSGVSFAYNIACAISNGLTPMVLTAVMAVNPAAPAWYLLLIAALISGMGFYLLARSDRVEGAIDLDELSVGHAIPMKG